MNELIKKWWFWVLIVIGIIVIGCISIFGKAFDLLRTTELEKEVKKIYKDATLYSSITSDTLFLELHNVDSKNNMPQISKINELIKNKIENGELIGFKKLITIGYINSGGKNEVLITRTEEDLERFKLIDELRYIDYNEYSNMSDQVSELLNMYTELVEK